MYKKSIYFSCSLIEKHLNDQCTRGIDVQNKDSLEMVIGNYFMCEILVISKRGWLSIILYSHCLSATFLYTCCPRLDIIFVFCTSIEKDCTLQCPLLRSVLFCSVLCSVLRLLKSPSVTVNFFLCRSLASCWVPACCWYFDRCTKQVNTCFVHCLVQRMVLLTRVVNGHPRLCTFSTSFQLF